MILGKWLSWISCSDIQRKLQQWFKNVRLYLELSAEDTIIWYGTNLQACIRENIGNKDFTIDTYTRVTGRN